MKIKCLIILLLASSVSWAQGEANIWYFGQNAGLDFTSGNPVAITTGQLSTEEGCASISSASGQLLFYTDGTTVYNSIHQVMINGTDLFGHSSSSQSATIVPKPGSTTLYYIFTLDFQAGTKGLRYSIVDISLNAGLGEVTSKNTLIYEPSCEKMGLIKHANNTDYWIVTHDRNNNHFFSHRLTQNGIDPNPTISIAGDTVLDDPNTANSSTQGYMKISTDGTKLAYVNLGIQKLQLFDFNNQTGSVSNPLTLLSGFTQMYGVEFSPNSKVLYHSNINSGILYQFDLEATNIPASVVTLNYGNTNVVGALQLGPDKKIYLVNYLSNHLSVINNPNTVGTGCNFQLNAITLDTQYNHIGTLGLPSFNQSFFFTPAIQLTNSCVNQSINFTFNTNQNVTAALWDFGDGATSDEISPTHTYATSGAFQVTVNVSSANGNGTNTRSITIYPKPTLLSSTVSLKQCDDNNDGFSAFNLNEAIPLLVANDSGLTITFHESLTDAESETAPIVNPTNYTNQIVSNYIVFARIENANGCFRTAQINLQVSTTLIPAAFQLNYSECDDTASGSNTDGIATFNFSDTTAQVQALYPSGQLLDITYYKNLIDALAEQNKITNTGSYSNIGYPNIQNIYIRVDSQINNECLGLGHHITLNVDRIPIVQPLSIKQCDDDHDGFFAFDTTNLETSLLNGVTNVTVSYTDSIGNPIAMTNPFLSNSQMINVKVKNNYRKQCEYNTTIQFTVSALPQAFPIPTNLTSVCDDETDPNTQNGIYSFDTSTFQSTILGNQTGMIVKYFDQNNSPLPSPLPNPLVTGSKNIKLEVINSANPDCKALYTIPLIVKEVPRINTTGTELICSNNPNFTKNIDAGLLNPATSGNYTYQWYFNEVTIPNANQYNLTVNTAGVYKVIVTNAAACSSIRTIIVTASNTATIENIQINDLQNENSIVIMISGSGNYVYSIDNSTFQTANSFTNLEPGFYNIYVKDLNECGITTAQISVLGIPKYFTPNDDGVNDFWNVIGINNHFNSKSLIKIFDRYGKLVNQFQPLSSGWNGMYNNRQMPSDDYWYVIQLQDGRTAKGHFSLIR